MHMIAGPNGAGKSTVYARRIQLKSPQAPFVQADNLARSLFGHPAATC